MRYTFVSVVRFRKILNFVVLSGKSHLTLHICESVFRKSFVENVEVFLLEGWHGTTLTSYRYLWRVAFCVPYASYLSECGALCRLFPVRSFHNLQQDKRKSAPHFLYV